MMSVKNDQEYLSCMKILDILHLEAPLAASCYERLPLARVSYDVTCEGAILVRDYSI